MGLYKRKAAYIITLSKVVTTVLITTHTYNPTDSYADSYPMKLQIGTVPRRFGHPNPPPPLVCR